MARDNAGDVRPGIFALPNEILLSIFNLFSTPDLLQLTSTCRHFHSLVLRLVHNRLQIAAGLDGHTLYLECYPPSQRLTDSKIPCGALGTPGLDEVHASIDKDSKCVGQIEKLGQLYTRFKPLPKEPDIRSFVGNRAGDIPGSRTWRSPNVEIDPACKSVVERIVTVDANDLFSQLSTLAYLGKRERTRGLLFSMQDVSEGTIRVWRDWLSKQCETRHWSGGDRIVIRHGGRHLSGDQGNTRRDSVVGVGNPREDPNILWINTRAEKVGVKFRVKEKRMRRNNFPILFENEVEVPVSYLVELEEVLVKTTHLLLRLEDAQKQMSNASGKAIVFGSFRAE